MERELAPKEFFSGLLHKSDRYEATCPRCPPLPSPSLPNSAQIELTAKHDEIRN
jgi:hypothetical protein